MNIEYFKNVFNRNIKDRELKDEKKLRKLIKKHGIKNSEEWKFLYLRNDPSLPVLYLQVENFIDVLLYSYDRFYVAWGEMKYRWCDTWDEVAFTVGWAMNARGLFDDKQKD